MVKMPKFQKHERCTPPGYGKNLINNPRLSKQFDPPMAVVVQCLILLQQPAADSYMQGKAVGVDSLQVLDHPAAFHTKL